MEKTHKIFLDDWRKPESGFTLVKSKKQFNKLLQSILEKADTWIEEISFDYDLGYGSWTETGLACFKDLEKVCVKYGLEMPKITVHSGLPGANKYFQEEIKKYEKMTGEKVQYKYQPRW